jgi:two-component system OmpR family sensor kinase
MPLVSKVDVPPGALTHPADAIDEALVDALRRRNAELSEAITARDNFLAIAAHELRNPMTPIVGQVQRLHRLVKARACTLEDVELGLRRIEWLIELYIKRATTPCRRRRFGA